MPRKRLTVTLVERITPPKSGRLEIFDTLLPSFALRVTANGAKSYCAFYRVGTKLRRYTIGDARKIKLEDARDIARQAFTDAIRGTDRAAEKVAARRTALTGSTALNRTFAVQAREFIKRHVAGQRRAPETAATIEKLIDAWGPRAVDDIAKADVLAHLDAIQDAGHERTRDRRLLLIRQLFNWLIERGITNINPASGVRKLQPGGVKRQRVLSNDELRAIWGAAEEIGGAPAAFVKLLMLCGQRRSETAAIEWSEVDTDAALWTVPPEKFKGNVPQLVPLPQLALDVLAALPRYVDANGELRPFAITSAAGKQPYSNYDNLKKELDRRSGVTGWVLHDLRRSMRTNLSKIGVNADVAERIIGHLPQGIRSVYDRHDFLDEKRAGLDRWAARLQQIVDPTQVDAKVTHLKRL